MFKCLICKRLATTVSDEFLPFFFWGEDAWCKKHVPIDVKQKLGYKK